MMSTPPTAATPARLERKVSNIPPHRVSNMSQHNAKTGGIYGVPGGIRTHGPRIRKHMTQYILQPYRQLQSAVIPI